MRPAHLPRKGFSNYAHDPSLPVRSTPPLVARSWHIAPLCRCRWNWRALPVRGTSPLYAGAAGTAAGTGAATAGAAGTGAATGVFPSQAYKISSFRIDMTSFAPPARRLSATVQKLTPFSTDTSCRTRDTYTLSSPCTSSTLT